MSAQHNHKFDTIVFAARQRTVRKHPGNVASDQDEIVQQTMVIRACRCGETEMTNREIPFDPADETVSIPG